MGVWARLTTNLLSYSYFGCPASNFSLNGGILVAGFCIVFYHTYIIRGKTKLLLFLSVAR